MKTYLILTVLGAILPLLVEGRATYRKFKKEVENKDYYHDYNQLVLDHAEDDGKTFEKRKFVGKSYAASSSIRLPEQRKKIFSGLDKLKGCTEDLIPVSHSSIECTQYSGCRVECEEGFVFPNDRTSLMFTCVDGHWLAGSSDYRSVPDCLPEEDEEYDEDEEEDIVQEEGKEEPKVNIKAEGDGEKESGTLDGYEAPNEIENSVDMEMKPCTLPDLKEHSRVNCAYETYCEVRCHKGYKLPGPKGHVLLTCTDGQWVIEGTNETKIPLCEPERPVCEGEPFLPSKSSLVCDSERRCEATCEKGHKFPSGKSSVDVTCALGMWILEADDEDKTKGCVREMLTCGGKRLAEVENATIECDDKSCTGTCAPGFKFPNGNSTITAFCNRNKWEIPDTSFEILPECVRELRSHTKCNGSDYLVFPNLGAYKVNTTHVSWVEAQKSCIQEGAHLAVINSKDELELMKELIAAHHPKNGWTYALIGFNDMAKKGVWITVLGSMLDSIHYAKWAPRNPSKMNERCGALDHRGRLHDVFCYSEQMFICEKV